MPIYDWYTTPTCRKSHACTACGKPILLDEPYSRLKCWLPEQTPEAFDLWNRKLRPPGRLPKVRVQQYIHISCWWLACEPEFRGMFGLFEGNLAIPSLMRPIGPRLAEFKDYFPERPEKDGEEFLRNWRRFEHLEGRDQRRLLAFARADTYPGHLLMTRFFSGGLDEKPIPHTGSIDPDLAESAEGCLRGGTGYYIGAPFWDDNPDFLRRRTRSDPKTRKRNRERAKKRREQRLARTRRMLAAGDTA
jgi:hypothetical protein